MSDKTPWWIRVDEGVWPDGVSGRYATREEIARYEGEWIEYCEVARICREHNAAKAMEEQSTHHQHVARPDGPGYEQLYREAMRLVGEVRELKEIYREMAEQAWQGKEGAADIRKPERSFGSASFQDAFTLTRIDGATMTVPGETGFTFGGFLAGQKVTPTHSSLRGFVGKIDRFLQNRGIIIALVDFGEWKQAFALNAIEHVPE